jgi:two-component system sensor histidine kinase TctE
LQSAIAKRSPDDMSPIKRAVPREVSSLVGATNNLFAQVRNSFAEKDAFIANAAHQLRNPIAGLLSQAEAAERTKDPEVLRERVRDVAEAARRTARLTQQLLSMERVSQSPALEQFETFDIVNLVREQLTNTASRAYKQDVELSLTGVEDSVYIKGNAVLMGEAFDNLIDNALRYGSPDNGKIETRVQLENNQVTITVADNGTGIAEGLLPEVFERFTRGAEDGSDGCGLGLAIARSIVQKHNGELNLSTSKKGTEASIILQLPQGINNASRRG